MTIIDLQPATQRMTRLIEGISDDQLGDPTPCADTSLGDLLDHVRTLTPIFTAVAKKDSGGAQSASADAAKLGDDWRTRIPADLVQLADAWRDPEAWSGMTEAGGAEMPAQVAGLITLDELVIHGWDIARASGQDYDCDRESLEAILGFVTPFSAPGHEAEREGLFGPVVEVPDDAPLLDRVIGLTGRDPGWSPA
jgi:uncharacterized protein (TIGR03086 family)